MHHHHGHHGHGHGGRTEAQPAGQDAVRRGLWWALGINVVFMVIEVIGGLVTGSLALLADAGHMVTDVAALSLAIVVERLVVSAPTPRRTFGLMRAEVIGAFINGGTLVLIVGWIFFEAYRRLGQPVSIQGPLMLAVAVAGLIANIAGAAVLAGGRVKSINIRGAFLHLTGDALGSVGAIVAGAVIWLTGWTPIDAIASVVIGVIILWTSLHLVRETLGILLNATPAHLDYHEIKEALEANPHVQEVFDLHIWTIASGIPALTGHVRLKQECSDTCHWQECLAWAQKMLRDQFEIVHSTLQLEPPSHERDERPI